MGLNSNEVMRLDRDISDVRDDVGAADDKAQEALYNIAAHERECSLRYGSIDKRLEAIPAMQKSLDELEKKLYLALLVLAALMKSDKITEVLKLFGVGS